MTIFTKVARRCKSSGGPACFDRLDWGMAWPCTVLFPFPSLTKAVKAKTMSLTQELSPLPAWFG